MTCASLLAALAERGITPRITDGRFLIGRRAVEALPYYTRQIVAAHRDELLGFLTTGRDLVLDISKARLELKRLGLIQLITGAWTHPRGDEHADQILIGLLDPTGANDAALDELAARGIEARVLPTRVPARDLREVHPGCFTWTQTTSQPVERPFPKVHRLGEES
jgi:hypothetical protein